MAVDPGEFVLRATPPRRKQHKTYCAGVIPVYTRAMKTAISLPDDMFDRVTRRAQELGVSRSEFFARAARRYLDELDARSTMVRVNEVLERLGHSDELSAGADNAPGTPGVVGGVGAGNAAGAAADRAAGDAAAAGRQTLAGSDDEW